MQGGLQMEKNPRKVQANDVRICVIFRLVTLGCHVASHQRITTSLKVEKFPSSGQHQK